MDIENIIINQEIDYLKNLIKYCNDLNLDCNTFQNKLNNILKKNISSETESPTFIKNSEKEQSSESKEILYSDDYLYKKPWVKLSPIHKIIKLKEFISKLIVSETEEEKLKNQISSLVHNKILSKKDKVKYDSEKGVVIGIPILSHKNGKYTFS